MISDRTKRNLKRTLESSLLAKVGAAILIVMFLAALFAPVVAPHNPTQQVLEKKNQPPVGMNKSFTTSEFVVNGTETERVTNTTYKQGTWDRPLGADPLGRGIFSRLLYGARTSLLVGIIGSGLGAAIGAVVGLFSGYHGGKVDDLLMRSVDVALALPGLVLAITVIGIVGPLAITVPDPFVLFGLAPEMPPTFTIPGTVTIVIAIVSWEEFARLARGEGLSIRETDYIKAARSIGVSDTSIIRTHMIPNAITPILILWTLGIGRAILLESTLSFLGFSGTTLSWGYDIAVGREYLATSWWVATMPGIAIMLTVIGTNLVGDWLRDALDPNLDVESL